MFFRSIYEKFFWNKHSLLRKSRPYRRTYALKIIDNLIINACHTEIFIKLYIQLSNKKKIKVKNPVFMRLSKDDNYIQTAFYDKFTTNESLVQHQVFDRIKVNRSITIRTRQTPRSYFSSPKYFGNGMRHRRRTLTPRHT